MNNEQIKIKYTEMTHWNLVFPYIYLVIGNIMELQNEKLRLYRLIKFKV